MCWGVELYQFVVLTLSFLLPIFDALAFGTVLAFFKATVVEQRLALQALGHIGIKRENQVFFRTQLTVGPLGRAERTAPDVRLAHFSHVGRNHLQRT